MMRSNKATAASLLHEAAGLLERSGIADARFDAGCLAEYCFEWNTAKLAAHLQDVVSQEQAAAFYGLVERRRGGEPLQYILGEWEFMGLRFLVGPGVLIPRPDTEVLVEQACAYLHRYPGSVVYDLCAGSGCVGLSVAKLCPDCHVYLVEKSGEAFAFLQKNAVLHSLTNATLLQRDIFLPFADELPRPNLLLSNPPYIPTRELPTLQAEVRKEPAMALDGGTDGLLFYRLLAERFLPLLPEPGMAAVECGEEQASMVAALFHERGFITESRKDLNGIERVVLAQRSSDRKFTISG